MRERKSGIYNAIPVQGASMFKQKGGGDMIFPSFGHLLNKGVISYFPIIQKIWMWCLIFAPLVIFGELPNTIL